MQHIKRRLARILGPSAHFFHARTGTFLSGDFSNGTGSRPYKLYIPRSYTAGTPIPLLVALHGCTQDPDNFATGTRFNVLADKYNFLVLYPQQTGRNNLTRCWNWFIRKNQVRNSGEPALLAAMVDYIAAQYAVDTSRIFITGISAGAAMAVIMGTCYPDYFAAIGVHSGVEYKAAFDLVSAQIAMSRGGPDPKKQGKLAYLSAGSAARVLPVIVFHGNNDRTVAPINGDQVIQQFISTGDYADDGSANNSVRADPDSVRNGQVPGGYSYTIYTYAYRKQMLLQHYKIDGLGHAWSGGDTTAPATFTDPNGPDASLLMWNFFASHPKVQRTATPVTLARRGDRSR
jgi:poly(hydroxyalkanoate) depolymerase family esterase